MSEIQVKIDNGATNVYKEVVIVILLYGRNKRQYCPYHLKIILEYILYKMFQFVIEISILYPSIHTTLT